MNKKSSYLRRVQLPRTPAEWLAAVMNFIFFLCGMLAVGCVVLITVYMIISGVPAIRKIGLFKFLLGTEWASTAADPKFGILPFILSSIYGTLGATLIGVPVGLLTAVFLSKAADPKVWCSACWVCRCWCPPWQKRSARPPAPVCSAPLWCFPS